MHVTKRAVKRAVNKVTSLFIKPQYSDYLLPVFLKHIDRHKVTMIFELGSRDGLDAIALQRYFKARVVAFECNPEAISLCSENIKNNKSVRLVKNAVWHKQQSIDFYPVINSSWSDGSAIFDGQGNQIVNIGASSCYSARGDYLQQYTQTKTTVDAIRLDQYCLDQQIASVDLLCIDLQGAALNALVGMGDILATVKYILIELENKPIYNGQSLFYETDQFLQARGFVKLQSVYRDEWFSDYLYVRTDQI